MFDTVADWERVLWTDESSFEIGKVLGPVRVWREKHKKYDLDCLTLSFRSGRTSIMIWGAFTAACKLPLIWIPPGCRSSSDFISAVYERALEPFLTNPSCPSNLILMADGAPVHRSQASKSWHASHSIVKLDWAANSPDLNPMENIWKILKSSISKVKRPESPEHMYHLLVSEWEAIPKIKLESLVASMPERIRAVKKAKGGATRW